MTDRNFKPDSGTDLVFEDAGSTDRLRITDGGSTILYEDGGAAALTIDTDGKIGIGITDPSVYSTNANNLVVGSTSGAAGITIVTQAGVGSYLAFADGTTVAEEMQGAIAFNHANNSMLFGTNASVDWKMVIDTSGNVGIPTVNASHKLQVTGTAGLSTGTAWTNTSDERIKTNIKTIENALEKIKQLRPVSYNYSKDYLDQHPELSDSKTYNSFIAQEYEQVFPDAVSVGENLERVITEAVEAKEAVLDKDGNEISPAIEAVEEVREILVEDMLQFTPHDLNMYLVGAVKELSAKVTALENA